MRRNNNTNASRDDEENPCIDPALLTNYNTGYASTSYNNTGTGYNTGYPSTSYSNTDTDYNTGYQNTAYDVAGTSYTSPYTYQDASIYSATGQASDVTMYNAYANYNSQGHMSMGESAYTNLNRQANMGGAGPSSEPTVIQCKLYFLIAARKTVQVGKEFVAVARITREYENPFVPAQGMAYHYEPDTRHQQFNTTVPLSVTELAGAECDDRAFTVHKTSGTSCAPAGTYVIYRLKRTSAGMKNLRFEASWDWGEGFVGKAAYDFVFLTASDEHEMKPYTALQKKLLDELWPGWKDYVDC